MHTSCHINYYNLSPKNMSATSIRSNLTWMSLKDHQRWSRFDLFCTLILVHSASNFVAICLILLIRYYRENGVPERADGTFLPSRGAEHTWWQHDIAFVTSYAWWGRQVLKCWHFCSCENLLRKHLRTFGICANWNSIILQSASQIFEHVEQRMKQSGSTFSNWLFSRFEMNSLKF